MNSIGNEITMEGSGGSWSAWANQPAFIRSGTARGGDHNDPGPWICIGFCARTDNVGWSGLKFSWTTPYDCREAMI